MNPFIDLWHPYALAWLPTMTLAEAASEESYSEAVVATLLITAGLAFITSVLLGKLCDRLNLPAVLGDLAAGVVLGGSVLGILVFSADGPAVNGVLLSCLKLTTGAPTETVMSAYRFEMDAFIHESANIGLLTLLFVTGLESNLKELIQVGSQAATVATTGVLLPFALGTITLIAVFHLPIVPAIFAGAALTATSIGITAKVLQEMGQLQSQEGQIILGAAILDDILGIVILALVLSLAETGEIELASLVTLLASAVGFVLLAVLLNRYFCPIFSAVVERFKDPAALLLLSLAFLNALALLAVALGLEALLGAFAAGLVLSGTRRKEELMQLIQPFVYVYTTIFFVTIGASVNLSVLNPFDPANRAGLIVAGCLIAIAILGKVVAGFVVFSNKPVNRWVIGAGMIPRGEVGLVFAGLGASTGILSDSLDAAVIIMVIATTLIAPLLLKTLFPDPNPQEAVSL
ncbi:MAG: cation:proton antiporter [Cyanobacteria bacterium P01_G01_bin.38]